MGRAETLERGLRAPRRAPRRSLPLIIPRLGRGPAALSGPQAGQTAAAGRHNGASGWRQSSRLSASRSSLSFQRARGCRVEPAAAPPRAAASGAAIGSSRAPDAPRSWRGRVGWSRERDVRTPSAASDTPGRSASSRATRAPASPAHPSWRPSGRTRYANTSRTFRTSIAAAGAPRRPPAPRSTSRGCRVEAQPLAKAAGCGRVPRVQAHSPAYAPGAAASGPRRSAAFRSAIPE